MYSEDGPSLPGHWWESFNSPELNRLVGEALGDNFSIREAWARLKQAGARADKTKAGLGPNLSVQAGYTRAGNRSETKTGRVTQTQTESFSLGLAASYEIDLWGRLRSLREADALSLQAGRADVESAAMTVAASVAETWIELVSTRQELRVLGAQIRTNAAMLELQELRFEKSLASSLDVLQQRETLARSRSQIPPLKAKEQLMENALALLLGQPPGVDLKTGESRLPKLTPLPKTGLPADLLAMRPDVRAAGLKLKSADWEIAAARADRLPSLSLTGRAEYGGPSLDLLFGNWLMNLAANIVGPIFDSGRRQAEVDRTRAVAEERLATYEKTVFTAVREVEDGLVKERHQKDHIRALERQLVEARRALAEAETRYANGLDNFLPTLTERLSVQNLEREIIAQRAMLLKYRVALFRALGGDWTGKLTPDGLTRNKDGEPKNG